MSIPKKSLWSDLNGMLRGVNMIRESYAKLPSQRVILTTRRITKAQRQSI